MVVNAVPMNQKNIPDEQRSKETSVHIGKIKLDPKE